YVVPEDAPLIVNAKIQITDIDKLFVGQEASVRLSALDMDRTPDITGAVVRMSADVLQDPNTGFSFYEAHLELNQNDMADLQGQELVPGMPAEVFIATADRTPLNYLLKPFLDYFSTAFREG
ncbi:HlyD family type I secretion periplasmic adaptor subunit, partial [Tateyamaria sp.]|nr:HlyD family type I secretion periplasmic adaptor subunit [Tateyamaria sp.]